MSIHDRLRLAGLDTMVLQINGPYSSLLSLPFIVSTIRSDSQQIILGSDRQKTSCETEITLEDESRDLTAVSSSTLLILLFPHAELFDTTGFIIHLHD